MAMNSSGSSFQSDRRSSLRRATARAWLLGLLGVALVGCDSVLDDDDDTMHVRTINLVDDSPALQFKFEDTVLGGGSTAIPYTGVGGFNAAPPGSHQISLAAIPPDTLTDDDTDDDPIPVGTAVSQSFEKDVDYTIVAFGKLSSPQIFVLSGTGLQDTPANDKVILTFVHAATRVQAVDIYLTAPEAQIGTPQLMGTLSATQSTSPTELTLVRGPDVGENVGLSVGMTIEVRAVGTGEVLYKSAEITVNEQSRVTFVVNDNLGPGPAMVSLFQVEGSQPTIFADENETAALRFAHVSATTPALDILPGTSQGQPLAQNIAFRGVSDYTSVRDGEVDLVAVPTGQTAERTFIEEFPAAAGQFYTAYAVGPFQPTDDQTPVDAVVTTESTGNRRSISTQMSYRILHAASSLENEDPLDVYVTLPDQPVEFDTDGDSVDEDPDTAAQVSYQVASNYIPLKGGTYDAHFALRDRKTILFGPVRFTIENGSVKTLVLTESENGTLDLLAVDDTRR